MKKIKKSDIEKFINGSEEHKEQVIAYASGENKSLEFQFLYANSNELKKICEEVI